jgi:hypothetical protein
MTQGLIPHRVSLWKLQAWGGGGGGSGEEGAGGGQIEAV